MLYRVRYGKRDVHIGFSGSREKCQKERLLTAKGLLEKVERRTRGKGEVNTGMILGRHAPVIYCCLTNHSKI